ncbi:MAG: chemotaxis protein MotB, partial [Bdellovibrionales bacterium]|nr:chemotaxis protein MotB [Bdellovibrionales bacterium]
MAEKEPMIVIKKVTNVVGGGHGGAWKVAFADFMTAMMAFFLVMWLVNATEDVKQNVSDYFSTPSIIEYNFSNYGVELTLEKLFLDLMNEPLRFFEQFITPVDHTPNIMMMGTKKIVMHHIAEKLGDKAENVVINEDQISFDIPADVIFFKGTAKPSGEFIPIMEQLKGLTEGLEDSNIFIDSEILKS